MKAILAVPADAAPKGVHLEDQVQFATENLSLGYLSAALGRHGIEAAIVDAYHNRYSAQRTAEAILSVVDEGDIVGFTVLQETIGLAKLVVSIVRQLGYAGPIVLGGWAASTAPRELMDYIPDADFLIVGEAEESLALLVESLSTGADIARVPGLWYRRGSVLMSSPARPLTCSLDSLGRPDHYLYCQVDKTNVSKAPMPILTSRGCSWGRCSFCSTAAISGTESWRYRSAESVMDEIRWAHEELGVRNFFFTDDSFFGPCQSGIDRAQELARRIRQEKLDIRFALDCRVPDFEPGLFALLREVGLERVFLGIESGVDATLARFRKGFTREAVKYAVGGLLSMGIDIVYGYIVFEPYMTLPEVKENIDFMIDELGYCDPTKFVKRLVPYPDTDIYRWLERDGLLCGQYPMFGFQFQDANVARLYETVSERLQPVLNEYRSACESDADGTARELRAATLNQRARAIFNDTYEEVARGDVSGTE